MPPMGNMALSSDLMGRQLPASDDYPLQRATVPFVQRLLPEVSPPASSSSTVLAATSLAAFVEPFVKQAESAKITHDREARRSLETTDLSPKL